MKTLLVLISAASLFGQAVINPYPSSTHLVPSVGTTGATGATGSTGIAGTLGTTTPSSATTWTFQESDRYNRILFTGTAAVTVTAIAPIDSTWWTQYCNATTQTMTIAPAGHAYYSGSTGGTITTSFTVPAPTIGAACVVISSNGTTYSFSRSSIDGAAGAAGATGATGTAGATGATGATGSGGGSPGGTSGQMQYNNSSAFGGVSNTVVIDGGTNVISGALAANTRLLITANVAQNTAAIAVTQANVTIECPSKATITRSTASTNLFTVTGANFRLVNCTLDGNSVNGGSLVSGGSGADKMTITGNTFQNAGTNSSLGVINIKGGSDDIIELNRGISITDYFITVDGSAAVADNGLIRGNRVTGTNPGIQVLSSTNTTQAWTITENNVWSGGGKCFGIGGSIPDIGAIQVGLNHCTLTATSASQGYVFNGLANGAIVGFNSFDGAGQVNAGGFEIGDCVGGSVTGNTVRGAFGVSMQILDNGGTNPCAVTGNTVEVGVPNGAVSTYGIFVGNSGQGNSGINLTGNSVTFLAITYYASTQAIHVGGGTGNFSQGNCTLSGNNVYDNGALLNAAATISAIAIGSTADGLIGTTNDCMVSGGTVMVPAKGSGTSSTGIVIGSGAADTQVSGIHLVPGTAAVLVSDSGTRSRIDTHVVKGTCVLGTSCAVTFANRDIFTGSGTYACTATDQTAAAAVKVVNTSATVATFTGTGTDTLSYVCSGY